MAERPIQETQQHVDNAENLNDEDIIAERYNTYSDIAASNVNPRKSNQVAGQEQPF